MGSGGGSPTSKMGYCGGVPVEDMQALAITSLSAADVAKQYEHIRELGKGTYGKVDLVAHRTQGELVKASGVQRSLPSNTVLLVYLDCQTSSKA